MAKPAVGEPTDVQTEPFKAWTRYWGELARVDDPVGETVLYGFENVSEPRPSSFAIPATGTAFGFVAAGSCTLTDDHGSVSVSAGQWFALPRGSHGSLTAPDTRVVASVKTGFSGLRAFGGPIEVLGRLKYIDLCSDTLLAGPPLEGDPCLNHLHFPPGIDQTEHTHPSVRSGVIARGLGWCETPAGRSELSPGVVFMIPRDGLHRFLTNDETMDVIAYHPDSDWGPTDESHPMVNRTLVDGQKVDNTIGLHAQAEVIGRQQ